MDEYQSLRINVDQKYLLDLRKVVLRVFVENKLSDWTEGVLSMWPDFG
jgi:hypothetical protein